MSIIINIKESNNNLDFKENYCPIVCGNSNYVLKFDFSEQWKNCKHKVAFFVVDGNKLTIDFEGDECKVPILPNASFVLVSLLSNDGEKQLMTTDLKIRLEPTLAAGDLSEFDIQKSTLSNLLGAVNKIENGKLAVDSAKIAQNVSNENLLINGDFKINQRGQNYYSGMSAYTVDRWRNSGTYLTVNEDKTITISHFGGWNYFYQRIEDISKFLGKTVTFTVNIKEISYTNGNPVISLNDGSTTNSEIITQPGIYSITKTISETATKLDCRLLLNNTAMASGETSDISSTIEWAKLEVGETATNFIPKNTATELSDCQRYGQLKSNAYTFPTSHLDCAPVMRTTGTTSNITIDGTSYKFRDAEIY